VRRGFTALTPRREERKYPWQPISTLSDVEGGDRRLAYQKERESLSIVRWCRNGWPGNPLVVAIVVVAVDPQV
jgi:hypothetical protein